MKHINSLCIPGLALVFTLLLAAPAFAGNAEKLNGTWMLDVKATIAAAREMDRSHMVKENQLEAAQKMRLTFDIPGKLFTVDPGTVPPERMPIDEVVENPDGTVLVKGEGLNDTYVFLPNGSIRLKNDLLVLKKAK